MNFKENNPDAFAAGMLALALHRSGVKTQGVRLLICEDEHQAAELEAALRFFSTDKAVFHFPATEVLPYDVFSPLQELVSERMGLLNRLQHLPDGYVVTAAANLLDRLPPRSYLDAHSLTLKVGDRFDPAGFRERLVQAGYEAVGTVRQHGEFAVRGDILDLFPMGAADAYRVEVFDECVERLQRIDVETQLSEEKVAEVDCLPARPFPLDEVGIESFRGRFRQRFSGDPNLSAVYRDVSRGQSPPGVEGYLPLFFDDTANLLDYLAQSTQITLVGDVEGALRREQGDISERHALRSGDLTQPLLEPHEAFFSAEGVADRLQATGAESLPLQGGASSLPDLQSESAAPAALAALLDSRETRVLVMAESAGRREALRDLLRPEGLSPADVDSWQAFQQGDMRLGLTTGPLTAGFVPEPGVMIFTEADLLGSKPPARRRRDRSDRDRLLGDVLNLADLAEGTPLVHQDHGVGRFTGMQSMQHGGITTEYLVMEFAEQARLFVPVSSLHLVRRYSGGEPEHAPLHRLGTEQWSKARKRAAEKARDAAAELLEQQARRNAAQGVAFDVDLTAYRQFSDEFPFTETEDQQDAIDAVMADLQKPRPMDRVVCGDVGFGKTEVALRAAFLAAHAGYQVCVLAPTTLLARQHERNFADRFAEWPIKVAGLSRLRSATAQKQVIAELENGKLDVVVGTHRLLRPDIRFNKLGLIIVDEEHRFGVRQKEQLKKLGADVHLLTLTATPIPRTLNMSLAGLRDLSLIATAPGRRLPVQTMVAEWTGALIAEACLRELRRGGQVYFVHNRVEDIERIARELRELLPQVRLAIAHGQMPERELEAVMVEFYHQRIDVLLCTTIIESGIDVPNANTIIINRADTFGLAQLHQLRGRVGRSHHRAYAYLLVPDRRALQPDAEKRLDAIEGLGELGVGFTLATQDMEIRGAGDLLGEAQSGHIEEIGFDLYMELLDRAVTSLRDGELAATPDLVHETEIELGLPALLPEDYVPDVHTRLVLYKRISRVRTEDDIRQLKVELIDRFGLLPQATENLFDYAALRLKASPLGVQRIEAGEDSGRFIFSEKTEVDPRRLIALVQSDSRRYSLNAQGVFGFRADMESPVTRLEFTAEMLQRLAD